MKLLLATNNKYKIIEYKKLCKNINVAITTLQNLNSNVEALEDQDTFEANAIQKARFYFDLYKMPVITDDSGLQVKKLNNFPGVNSKRWIDGSYIHKIKELLKRLNGNNSSSQMVTVIAYKDQNQELTFKGIMKGKLITPLKEKDGFGYDIGFYIESQKDVLYNIPQYKLKNSHRTKAFESFAIWYKNNN